MTFISAVILLLLVIDPIGGIPLFLAAMKNVQESHRVRTVIRECLIALVILLFFLFFGKNLLSIMQISQNSLGIAGGIVLFIIALRIIFPTSDGVFGALPDEEPFIVPLAVPTIAGPSAIATVLLLVAREPERLLEWFLALILAIAITVVFLALGSLFTKILGRRGLAACERLLGLILTAIAVQMFLNGTKDFIETLVVHQC